MGSPFVYVYSRAQAIEEGEQVRCPDKIRKEAGIKFPVFFTSQCGKTTSSPAKNWPTSTAKALMAAFGTCFPCGTIT